MEGAPPKGLSFTSGPYAGSPLTPEMCTLIAAQIDPSHKCPPFVAALARCIHTSHATAGRLIDYSIRLRRCWPLYSAPFPHRSRAGLEAARRLNKIVAHAAVEAVYDVGMRAGVDSLSSEGHAPAALVARHQACGPRPALPRAPPRASRRERSEEAAESLTSSSSSSEEASPRSFTLNSEEFQAEDPLMVSTIPPEWRASEPPSCVDMEAMYPVTNTVAQLLLGHRHGECDHTHQQQRQGAAFAQLHRGADRGLTSVLSSSAHSLAALLRFTHVPQAAEHEEELPFRLPSMEDINRAFNDAAFITIARHSPLPGESVVNQLPPLLSARSVRCRHLPRALTVIRQRPELWAGACEATGSGRAVLVVEAAAKRVAKEAEAAAAVKGEEEKEEHSPEAEHIQKSSNDDGIIARQLHRLVAKAVPSKGKKIGKTHTDQRQRVVPQVSASKTSVSKQRASRPVALLLDTDRLPTVRVHTPSSLPTDSAPLDPTPLDARAVSWLVALLCCVPFASAAPLLACLRVSKPSTRVLEAFAADPAAVARAGVFAAAPAIGEEARWVVDSIARYRTELWQRLGAKVAAAAVQKGGMGDVDLTEALEEYSNALAVVCIFSACVGRYKTALLPSTPQHTINAVTRAAMRECEQAMPVAFAVGGNAIGGARELLRAMTEEEVCQGNNMHVIR